VVRDVKTISLEGTIPAEIYFPCRQRCWGFFSVVVRTTASPAAAAGMLRSAVLSIDPDQPVADVRTIEQLVENSSSGGRFMVFLMGTFAGVALLLCATGIYGLVSGTVAQRTHEFGIRLALGATATNVLCLVLRQSLVLALAGVVLGLAGALATTRLLASLLYGVGPRDLTTFALGIAVLTFTVVLATFIPARRATRVNPMTALRYE
jgi:putative ABC transport system permease protein